MIKCAIVLLFLFFDPVRAQETRQEYYKNQFQGWDGIMFTCVQSHNLEWLGRICADATQHARFLAAAGKIRFAVCSNCTTFERVVQAHNGGLEHALTLELRLLSTDRMTFGGSATLMAYEVYVDAVGQAAAAGSPEASPKAGSLVF